MKNLSIKQISLYGFLAILLMIVISTVFMFIFANKYENLLGENKVFEKSHNDMLEYKYYTERLLTTYNLTKEKKLWINSKNKFKNSIESLKRNNKLSNYKIVEFYNVINNESNKIIKQLDHKLFKEQNIMEKSILRRLGEGLNSNEKSDYYLAISDLKNSIDYLKQYEEFLLEEIKELTNKQNKILDNKINQTKYIGAASIILIIIFGVIFVLFLLKLIVKVETNLVIKTNEQKTLLSLFDGGDSVLFIWNNDEHWSVEHVSNGIINFLGYSPDDFYTNKINYEECIHKDDLQRVAAEVEEASLSNQKFLKHKQYRLMTKNNEIKWVLDYTLIQRDNDGNIKHYIGVINDITDLKYSQEELQRKEKMLAQQSKMASMGEMLENIAHQWRQPLSIISTASSGIVMQKEFGTISKEQEIEDLNVITASVKHLSKTIDDFRDFFKPDKEKKLFSLKEIYKKTLSLLESKFKNREIKVIENIEDIQLYGLDSELIQAIMNILNNARDILETKDKNQKRLIFVDIYKQGDNAILKIKDNGGGIPKDIKDKIFEPYFTTKHKSQGTGIGLYMSEEMIAKHMYGKISVENETFIYEDKSYNGACFTISLPITKHKFSGQ
ncbi:MAG: PAS domain-containing protein [Arcobacteraceae bacterium]|nr:PAS domain-containing protein [Arcobacteraceae bacterium]